MYSLLTLYVIHPHSCKVSLERPSAHNLCLCHVTSKGEWFLINLLLKASESSRASTPTGMPNSARWHGAFSKTTTPSLNPTALMVILDCCGLDVTCESCIKYFHAIVLFNRTCASLAEASLDVTEYCQKSGLTESQVAEEIRRRVREETHLTCR